ncbi:MAG TPA: RagB/SusD family nutrient uptake outer membrane protein [Bacteroidales bacterium]|jgi:hypothetical protein|nr:RagB/SusD family nutrient uptake outer membrane protein [Bacteroidales bacterium]
MKLYSPISAGRGALLIILAGYLLFSSCSEDLLNKYPLDQITSESFFSSAEDLELYANRFYPLLTADAGYFFTIMIDQNSDNMAPSAFDPRLAGVRTVPPSGGDWEWSDIRQANYFLEHCNKAQGAESEINHYIGEVRFFRAYLYFNKVKIFGDVPWVSKPLTTNSPELMGPRTRRDIVVDSILADLDVAISYLKSVEEANPFRINKQVAMLLKARICLYEGTWEKYHQNDPFGVQGSDGSALIQKAEATARQLMDMNIYSIYKGPAGDEYRSLFNQLDYSGNPEVMLWKHFDLSLKIVNNVSRSLSGGGGNTGVTKGLIDSYLCTDGKPISVSPDFHGYGSLLEEFSDRDPRLSQTIYKKGDYQTQNGPGGAFIQFGLPPIDQNGPFRSTTGYSLRKGINNEYTQQTAENIGTKGSIIFRYAEALLIYAEAKAELGTLTQADADISVNLLRDRVNMPHLDINDIATDPRWDFPDLSPVINEVRRERRVEMAFEGTRWDDIARWKADGLIVNKRPRGVKYIGSDLEGAYKDANGNPTITIGVNLFVDEDGFVDPYQTFLPNGYKFNPSRDYLAPIPSNEITLNPNLKQNPGW